MSRCEEIFEALLNGEACNLVPKSRLEAYLLALYKKQGTGGGVDVTASVGQTIVVEEVDANGKPTKWKAAEYQEKICGTGMVELLNTTLAGNTESTVDITIKEGKTYYVTFNGVEYTCVGTLREEDGTEVCYIGNGAVAGFDDTGEPFAVACLPNDGVAVALIVDETIEQADIVVRGKGYVPIPVEHVSNAFPYYIEITGSGTDEDPYVCNDTVANVEAIFAMGRTVCVAKREFGFDMIYNYFMRAMESELGNTRYFIGYALGGINFNRLKLAPNANGNYDVEIRNIT